jgi:hypothetical protein
VQAYYPVALESDVGINQRRGLDSWTYRGEFVRVQAAAIAFAMPRAMRSRSSCGRSVNWMGSGAGVGAAARSGDGDGDGDGATSGDGDGATSTAGAASGMAQGRAGEMICGPRICR